MAKQLKCFTGPEENCFVISRMHMDAYTPLSFIFMVTNTYFGCQGDIFSCSIQPLKRPKQNDLNAFF